MSPSGKWEPLSDSLAVGGAGLGNGQPHPTGHPRAPSLWAWRQRSTHCKSLLCPAPALSGPTALSGGGCCWEEVQLPLSRRGEKGRRWGALPKLPGEISPGRKEGALLPGGWASGTLYSGCRGRLSPGSLPVSPAPRGRLAGIRSVPAPLRYGRGTGRQRSQASPEGAEGTRAAPPRPPARPRPPGQLGLKALGPEPARPEAPATACFNIPGYGEENPGLRT